MIGDLYDANNVVVGQAAVLIAPAFTPLPSLLTANLADPFDPTPFTSYTLTVAATSTYTLTIGGAVTTSLATASTGVQIAAAINGLAPVAALINAGSNPATVTPATSGGPYTIVLPEELDQGLTVQMLTGTVTLTGGLWTPVGATDQGWKYGTSKSVQTIDIEEQSTPVSMAINTQSVTYDGALSEDISRTLALAFNATMSVVAPATLTPGYDNLVLTDTVLYYAVCLVAQHYNGMPRWQYAPKCSQLSSTSVDFRRANAKRMYPVQFATLCKPSQIRTINFTAPHS